VTPATGPLPARRLAGYHSPQVDVDVRLNTNESPEPPPAAFLEAVAAAVHHTDLHRYPDREATRLRAAIGELHGLGVEQVWAANGSNEVLQSLLLAFAGPGRTVAFFEPTYALHSHIAALTRSECLAGRRDTSFLVPLDEADRLLARRPDVTLLCSPNNPTGLAEPRATVEHVLAATGGLVIVDEAYAQFSPWSAVDLLREGAALAVVRTFSKTWALAGLRLGYLLAPPDVVAEVGAVSLPYHLDSVKQAAGRLALGFETEMRERVARIVAARDDLVDGLRGLPVEVWPSDANFVLFRPRVTDGAAVWAGLLERSVLVRDISSWPGLEGCLRVTVGTPEECRRFLAALADVLGERSP
jgi:histidinol-phosphate aminotransferase